MRRRLPAIALALGLALSLVATTPASAVATPPDDAPVVAARVTGNLPTEGVALGLWDGGSVETLATDQPEIASVWTTVNGSLVGYLVGAPSFVNAGFLGTFPGGQLDAGTPVLAVVTPVTTPLPPVAADYSLATWTAFTEILLKPIQDVTTCQNCWPAYTGGPTIGVVHRWTEDQTLDVFVYSGDVADRAALEAQLNEFQTRLGIPWQYVATSAEADFHVFMGFDRQNPPATFPAWALQSLADQELISGWSAFATTSQSWTIGPSGVDPVDRFDIADAAVFVPFNQKDGTVIPRELLDTNIRHELVHTLGWNEHWAFLGQLMSAASSQELFLSDLEWDMLSLLYEDEVLPGMYDDQILDVITVGP